MSANMVQYYKNGDGWELATLETEELQVVHQIAREHNKRILEESFIDALAVLGKYQSPHNTSLQTVADVAKVLYERRALHIAVILDAALRRKVFVLRRNGAHAEV